MKLNQQEILDQKEQHQREVAEWDKYYDNLLITSLNDIKEKYEQKLQKELKSSLERFAEEQRTQQAQIASLSDQLDKLRRIKPVPAPRERTRLMSSQSIPSGDKLNVLKKGIFDYIPGTVNTNRGGAMENTTIDWTDQSVQRPVPKHITLATSTPLKPQAEDVADNEILAVPLPQEASKSHKQMVSGQEQSTINIIANEFHKLNPPKLQKLKGGTSPSAQLFLFGLVKEVKSVIKDRDLIESESIQWVREFTEGKARQQVDFFLDTSPVTTSEALLEHLLAAFTSGEDEAVIKSEFYGREQFSKESEDDFAEALQLLSRKILMVNPNFRVECNSALINQFASGLCDDIMQPLTHDLISRKPGISFIQFRAEIANLS